MILVVEDDPEVRDCLAELLKEGGCEFRMVGDGKSALSALRQANGAFCVVVLDILMPAMDGWAFRRAQLADPNIRHVPVFLLTGLTNPAQPLPEADEVFIKPFDAGLLLTHLKARCAHRRSPSVKVPPFRPRQAA